MSSIVSSIVRGIVSSVVQGGGAVAELPPEPAQFIINGAYATDTDWTKGSGWTIAAGVATCAAGEVGTLSQTLEEGLRNGNSYDFSMDIVANPSEGQVRVSVGAQILHSAAVAAGPLAFTFVSTTTSAMFSVRLTNGDEELGLIIDNVSLVPTP